MNIVQIIGLTLKISIFLTALSFGLKATPAEAFYLFRHPGKLLRSVLSMNLLMPALAIGMAQLLPIAPLIKVTLVALSVSPLAPFFPKKPLQAGANESSVFGLMVATAFLAFLLIPVTLSILEKIIHKPVEVSVQAFAPIIIITVIAPLFLGILMRYLAPAFTEKISLPVTRIAQTLLILAILPILFKLFPTVIDLVGNGTVIAIAAFSAIGLIIGHLLGGPEKTDRTVLALATASRHPAIALVLASANYNAKNLVLGAILMYLLIDAFLVFLYLKWQQKETPESVL